MIVFCLVLLLLVSDVLTIRDIYAGKMKESSKILFSLIVLLIPIIGISIYYATKSYITKK